MSTGFLAPDLFRLWGSLKGSVMDWKSIERGELPKMGVRVVAINMDSGKWFAAKRVWNDYTRVRAAVWMSDNSVILHGLTHWDYVVAPDETP